MKLSDRGFTLVELLLAFAILTFCLCGLLLSYIQMFILTDLSRSLILATNAVQARTEEIKNTNFDCLDTSSCSSCNCPTSTSCPGGCTNCFRNTCIFNIAGFATADAKGVVYITSDTGYVDLKRVRIEVSFKSRNRVIGGDKDLDGIADSGEDVNSKNELNSPVELVTLIAR
jgi:prepilin-type N-terminal cleavage/methylation domain-containing protein